MVDEDVYRWNPRRGSITDFTWVRINDGAEEEDSLTTDEMIARHEKAFSEFGKAIGQEIRGHTEHQGVEGQNKAFFQALSENGELVDRPL